MAIPTAALPEAIQRDNEGGVRGDQVDVQCAGVPVEEDDAEYEEDPCDASRYRVLESSGETLEPELDAYQSVARYGEDLEKDEEIENVPRHHDAVHAEREEKE